MRKIPITLIKEMTTNHSPLEDDECRGVPCGLPSKMDFIENSSNLKLKNNGSPQGTPLQENSDYPPTLKTGQIRAALDFLNSQQSSSGRPFPGSFVCRLNQSNGKTTDDWTVFNTALTVYRLNQLSTQAPFNYSILGADLLPAMIQSASLFLKQSKHTTPVDSFSFWPAGNQYKAAPDLDDTALVLNALLPTFPTTLPSPARGEGTSYREGEIISSFHEEVHSSFHRYPLKTNNPLSPGGGGSGWGGDLSLLRSKAWETFSAYRYSRGMKLAMQSRWAEQYPGVFATWIFPDQSSASQSHADPLVIDALALAHICHYLLDIGVTDIPGLGESLTLLSELLSHCVERIQSTASLKEAMQSLPLAQWMLPYYRSLPHFLSACAALTSISTTSHYLSPKIAAIKASVTALLKQSYEDNFSTDFSSLLWLADAMHTCHLVLPKCMLDAITQSQQADGGWQAIEICTTLQGDWRWTSRTVSTTIALQLLGQGANCASI